MVKVYFGTNRKPNRKTAPDDFGHEFSAEGLANLRFGMAEVTGEALDNHELFLAPERLPVDDRQKPPADRTRCWGAQTYSSACVRR